MLVNVLSKHNNAALIAVISCSYRFAKLVFIDCNILPRKMKRIQITFNGYIHSSNQIARRVKHVFFSRVNSAIWYVYLSCHFISKSLLGYFREKRVLR